MNNIINNLPWDVKSTINKVKNAVLNYTEMESKVREATNNDAWGASSTLLQELARATNQYQYFHEIMPIIYKRFAESQKNWRQIYKTLQLIEYLLKNGSENCIENVRDHVFEIKSLTNYQFLDEKGKDQGINVRHRAKEIIELVNDSERLKHEREKAQLNRNKYTGVASAEARYGGFGSGGSSNYGGFGSNDYPGNVQTSKNDPSQAPSDPSFYGSARRTSETKTSNSNLPQVKMNESATPSLPNTTAPSVKPVANLLDLDFSEPAAQPTPHFNTAWNTGASMSGTFQSNAPVKDDFADFQSAPTFQTSFPSAAPASLASTAQSGVGFTATNNSNTWDAFNSAPQAAQPAVDLNVKLQNSAVSPKKGDVWNSNLVSLDSLGKFNAPQRKESGPALNQMAASPAMTPSGNNFGTFNNTPSAGAGFGAFTAPNTTFAGQQSNVPVAFQTGAGSSNINWSTGNNQTKPLNANDLLM